MYLATPEMGAGPAVLVVPEDRELCDLLATEGFTALAPDLSPGQTADELTAAIDFLKPHEAVRGQGIAVIGSGTGAGLALWLGTHRPEDVVALVAVSGAVPADAEQPDWSRLTAAVQGHFAESDPTCPPDIVAGLEKSLGEAGVTVEFFTYPTDDPRFFDEDGDTARQAWIRTLEFLRKHLG
jgi:carboxymethylenebutenolidase